MLSIPKKVVERFSGGLKRYQGIIQTCRDRDVNESDTVTLIMDIFCEMLGYDKYSEITKEHQIRSTFCDLAIKIDGGIKFLIECKAIGITLKDNHIQQALNYAANQGCEWVILTNAMQWKVFKVIFGQPINQELVFEINFLNLVPRNSDDFECLYALSREGLMKSAIADYYITLQAKDKYTIGALLMTETVAKVIRRELKELNPNVIVEVSEIQTVIRDQVVKRELVEGDRAVEAQKQVRRIQKKKEALKKKELSKSLKVEVALPEDVVENPIVNVASSAPAGNPNNN